MNIMQRNIKYLNAVIEGKILIHIKDINNFPFPSPGIANNMHIQIGDYFELQSNFKNTDNIYSIIVSMDKHYDYNRSLLDKNLFMASDGSIRRYREGDEVDAKDLLSIADFRENWGIEEQYTVDMSQPLELLFPPLDSYIKALMDRYLNSSYDSFDEFKLNSKTVLKGQFLQFHSCEQHDETTDQMISNIFIVNEDIDMNDILSRFVKEVDLNQKYSPGWSDFILRYSPASGEYAPFLFVDWLKKQDEFSVIKPFILSINSKNDYNSHPHKTQTTDISLINGATNQTFRTHISTKEKTQNYEHP